MRENMNILITGTTGFVGRNLKECYINDYNIYSPSHDELDLLCAESVEKYLIEHKIDIVIHSANWNNTKRTASEFDVLSCNIRMFYNLASLQHYYKKMIYFGSGAEYSKNRSLNEVKESEFGAVIPCDAYGLSKYVMAKEALHSDKIYDLCLFGVYGKYEEWHRRFISNAICRAMYDMPITIEKNALFDYLYIDDLSKIVKWFIENTPASHRYNITSGHSVSLLELAEMVKAEFNGRPPIIVKEEGWKDAYSGSNAKLISEIPDISFSDVKENITTLTAFYRSKKRLINPERLI